MGLRVLLPPLARPPLRDSGVIWLWASANIGSTNGEHTSATCYPNQLPTLAVTIDTANTVRLWSDKFKRPTTVENVKTDSL